MQDMKEIKKNLEGVDSLQVFCTDLNGRAISLHVNPDRIETLVSSGVGFDGSSVAGISRVEDSDRLLVPVPETLRILDFADEKLAFMIGVVGDKQGVRSASDVRAVLEKVVAEAEADFGLRFMVGPEYEFFLLKGSEFHDDIHSDKAGYFHPDPEDKGQLVRRDIVNVLTKAGIRFEKTHHEVVASQHEINVECADPIWAADRTVLFKYVTRRIAVKHGLHASFMPKPFDGENRNAFHIHLSAQDTSGENAFYDADDEHNLSTVARQFVAGILKYARQTSIIMASTFNSYKAYIRDREAPIVRGWGLKNRSSMVRIPHSDSPAATRIELRSPDPAGNQYLQIATLISMGLRGIKEELDCGRPDVGSTYQPQQTATVWDERFLPKCMFEALVEAEKSEMLKDLLNEQIYTHYMDLKTSEWEDHRTHVTPREHQMYLSA